MPRASRQTAEELLAGHLEQGRALVERAGLVGDLSDYESWKEVRKRWIESTVEALEQIFDGSQEAEEFRSAGPSPASDGSWQTEYSDDLGCLRAALDYLISLREQLGFAPMPLAAPEPADERSTGSDFAHELSGPEHPVISELEGALELEQPLPTVSDPSPGAPPGWELGPPTPSGPDGAWPDPVDPEPAPAPSKESGPPRGPTDGKAVTLQAANGSVAPIQLATSAVSQPVRAGRLYLVHGRNETWKQAVVGLLERAGPQEITIVNERTSTRGTQVKEFAQQTEAQGYGLVLLTADDMGAPRPETEQEPYFSSRAGQGVVFEMGFLVAALGPQCVCVLYEVGVELPCDLDGIAYVRLDPAGTWQSKLLMQLRGAGLAYDLNSLASG
jgi:predicted nucleotide-binding protein